jgi:hypothetical protein
MLIEEFAPEMVCIQEKHNIMADFVSCWPKQESEEELIMVTTT